MKAELRMFLTAHPSASRIVDRARPRMPRDRSQTARVDGAPPPRAEGKPVLLDTSGGGFIETAAGWADRVPRVLAKSTSASPTARVVTVDAATLIAAIIDDPDAVFQVGISVWERYTGPYSEEMKPAVEMMINKRVAVRLVADRTRSWDHRKLGMPAMPMSGSTAPKG